MSLFLQSPFTVININNLFLYLIFINQLTLLHTKFQFQINLFHTDISISDQYKYSLVYMISPKFILTILTKKLCSYSPNINNNIFKCHCSHLSSLKYSLRNNFSSTKEVFFVFNHQNQPQLLKLQLEYRAQQNSVIFKQIIKQSTSILDQMKIFKIFKVLEGSPYNQIAYEQFFHIVQKSVKKKSDNMLLLLASVKQRIARNHRIQKEYSNAVQCYEESLDILEGSLVPPLFPYYSIYRQYGILHDEIGDKQKTIQILTEAVDILDDFVSHSDDNVSTSDYCKKQATAYNVLSRIDESNRNKWIEKANSIWQKYGENRFVQIEYAKTVGQNIKKLLKQDIQKGQAFYHFNLYKFQSKEMKDILKKAKQSTNS